MTPSHIQRELEALRDANVALVCALDRIRDVLHGDMYMQCSDVSIDWIINRAIKAHNLCLAEGNAVPMIGGH